MKAISECAAYMCLFEESRLTLARQGVLLLRKQFLGCSLSLAGSPEETVKAMFAGAQLLVLGIAVPGPLPANQFDPRLN